jgi:hypothetical protein
MAMSRSRPKSSNTKTMSVPEAGKKYFDLGRNASYAAAARGQLPVVRIGRSIRAVVARLEQMVGETRPGEIETAHKPSARQRDPMGE